MSLAKNAAPKRPPGVLAGLLILLYSALLTLVIAAMALRAAVSMLRWPKYRAGLGERFGRVRPDLVAAVAGRRVVWVHAVSVGEVLAATRLVQELGEALGDGWEIVVSTTTLTGQALARQKFGAERVFYTPIDFGFSVRAYLNALRPAAIVLIESGVWPRMMLECEKRGMPVMVANARVGDKSFKRAMKMRGLWSRVLRRATLWLAQSKEDAGKLMQMGVPAELVKVSGNLKYDIRAPKESRIAELIMEAAAGRPIVVAGSTLGALQSGEFDEELWLTTAYGGRLRNQHNALLVIAPRHPERFAQAWDTAIEFPTLRASELLDGKKGNEAFVEALAVGAEVKSVDIVVLDTIGDLASVYRIADLAFIGGSLVKRGGHNPLEPAQFGVPVVMGTSYENFRDIVTKMRSSDSIRIVKNQEELEAALVGMIEDNQEARAMGERGRKVFEEQQGATKVTVDVIVGMVKP